MTTEENRRTSNTNHPSRFRFKTSAQVAKESNNVFIVLLVELVMEWLLVPIFILMMQISGRWLQAFKYFLIFYFFPSVYWTPMFTPKE